MLASRVEISLYDIKRVKVGLSAPSFYLKANFHSGESHISPTVDLLQHEAGLQIEDLSQVRSVEVWRFHRCRKIAQINITRPETGSEFEHVLEKYNVVLRIKKEKAVSEKDEAGWETASSEGEEEHSIIDLLESVLSV